MALYTMEIPDNVVPTVTASVCMEYKYDENKLENESQDDFTHRMILELIRAEIKRCVYNYQSVQMQGDLDSIVSSIS